MTSLTFRITWRVLLAIAFAICFCFGCHSGSSPTAEVEGAIGLPKPQPNYYVRIHDQGHNYDYWQRTTLPQNIGSNVWVFTNILSQPRAVTVVNPGTIYWEENE